MSNIESEMLSYLRQWGDAVREGVRQMKAAELGTHDARETDTTLPTVKILEEKLEQNDEIIRQLEERAKGASDS